MKQVVIAVMVCAFAISLGAQGQVGTIRVLVRAGAKPVERARVIAGAASAQTDATGAAQLPAPVGKTAAEIAAVRIERGEAAGNANEDVMTVDYRGELRVVATTVTVSSSVGSGCRSTSTSS